MKTSVRQIEITDKMQNNSKKECMQSDYDAFIMPILMSLGLPEDKRKIIKTIENIEQDIQEILELTDQEMYSFFDATPQITMMRSKVDYALYEMLKNELVKLKDETYSITKKGRQFLMVA